ncbi:putative aldo/keto reductase [Geopyxis carbonaria]|nr:putative aldo/keto reductase [Geopyxis carbonaria]
MTDTTPTPDDKHLPRTQMEYRQLGRTGLKVSAISLGSWLTYGGHVSDSASAACLAAAWAHGINYFDTAEGYGDGLAESTLGAALREFGWPRCDFVISTKLNFGAANSCHPQRAQNTVGLSRKHIVEGMQASLARLGLEYVDVVYAHRPDRLTPMEETVRAFDYVISRGWAFYWGTSEWEAAEVAEACGVAVRLGLVAPVVEQPQYNLLHRENVEKRLAPLCERHGLGLAVFSPLKFGLLSGKYNDCEIPEGSQFSDGGTVVSDEIVRSIREKFDGGDEEVRRDLEVLCALCMIAAELGVTQSQLALAWILKNRNISSVITGASRPEEVVQNVKAVEVVKLLTDEVMTKIEAVVKNAPKLDPKRFGMP